VQQGKAETCGETEFANKRLSVFEPHTEVIRKGKAGQPNEFGKLVQVQEAENQIVTHYDVFEQQPSDRHLLLLALEMHR
jgi:IS5 family transposase